MNKDMISAVVINLDQSVSRWQFQQEQLARLGIVMRRWPAVKTTDFTEREYRQLSDGWERKLRPAEVACFLSHQMVWQYVAETNQPVLVLEDDALLSQRVPAILQALMGRADLDYVNLETRQRRKLLNKQGSMLCEDYALYRLYQDRNGSAAYVLFPSGARKLLARLSFEKPALADAFLSRAYDLNAWQVSPAAAIQTDQCGAYDLDRINPFPSTITPSDHARPAADNGLDYWRYKYRRLAAQLRMGWRQCSHLGCASRRQVPIHVPDFLTVEYASVQPECN